MDRFIGVSEVFKKIYNGGLKSNMDRFIALAVPSDVRVKLFKIQYGQIYSENPRTTSQYNAKFKIQYGQIYSLYSLTDILLCRMFKIQYGQIYSKIRYKF